MNVVFFLVFFFLGIVVGTCGEPSKWALRVGSGFIIASLLVVALFIHLH